MIQRRRRRRSSSSGSRSPSTSPAVATTGGSGANAAVALPLAPGSRSAASRAAMKASALWKRWPGSFSRARITTASSAGETWGLIELGRCGACETCFIAIATAESASNGTRPVSAS